MLSPGSGVGMGGMGCAPARQRRESSVSSPPERKACKACRPRSVDLRPDLLGTCPSLARPRVFPEADEPRAGLVPAEARHATTTTKTTTTTTTATAKATTTTDHDRYRHDTWLPASPETCTDRRGRCFDEAMTTCSMPSLCTILASAGLLSRFKPRSRHARAWSNRRDYPDASLVPVFQAQPMHPDAVHRAGQGRVASMMMASRVESRVAGRRERKESWHHASCILVPRASSKPRRSLVAVVAPFARPEARDTCTRRASLARQRWRRWLRWRHWLRWLARRPKVSPSPMA